MISKIYAAALSVSIALMAFFTYYAWSWLQSIGKPSAALDGYDYHDNLAWIVLIASTLVLAILANIYLWLTRQAWPLWSTLLYFAVFILLRYFWLHQSLLQFKKDNGLCDGSFSAGPLFGAVVVVIAAVFIFCDQFAVLQLHRTMFPVAAERDLESIPEPAPVPEDE